MSPMGFVILLAVAIAFLSIMTLKFKMHPVMTLFIVASFIGIASGLGVVGTMSQIKANFGGTLTGIGVLIIFGAIISSGINDTGAATSICNFFIRKFKGKNLELAPALTGFIMSIPVFGDIAIVLNAPICAILAKRKKINMALMAPMLNLGLTLTHGLVPPTPGILAVSILVGAEIGSVIIWGLVCSIVSFLVCYIVLRPILSKAEFIEPLSDYTVGIEPVAENAPIEQLLIEEENAPKPASAFLPLLIPAVMIAFGSICKLTLQEGTVVYTVSQVIGDSVVALFTGILGTALLVFKRRDKVIKKANENLNTLAPKAQFTEIVFNNWVARALHISIGPLLITAMGGAMGGILRANPAINEIGQIVAASNFPVILVPFVLAAILMAVCGSMTTASMTAAALIAPMLQILGISPEIAALAIGSGSMCFWHVNNSGFWIFCSMYNFNAKQGLKFFTTTNLIGGVVAFITLVVLHLVGLVG